MLVQQARDVLLDSELVTQSSGTTIYTAHRLDVAIKKAFERFMLETGIDRTTLEVTTESDKRYVVPSENASDFLPGNMYAQPFIDDSPSGTTNDWRGFKTVNFNVMRRWYDDRISTGSPRHIAWLGERAYLFPVPDGEYTITFPYRRTFTDYAPGSQGEYDNSKTYHYYDCVTYATDGKTYVYINTTSAAGNAPTTATHWKQVDLNVVNPWTTKLNCIDTYAYEVVGSGGLFHLVKGIKGHTQWPIAGQEFEALIQRAKGQITVDGVYLPNRMATQ